MSVPKIDVIFYPQAPSLTHSSTLHNIPFGATWR
jgi:hypothetical protein